MTEKDKDSYGVSYKSKWIQSEMVLEAISCVLDGEEVSDFEMSFPIVRQVWDLVEQAKT